MNTWTVALHPLAETELLALPADMQARFLRIAEMLEDFGPQRVGLPTFARLKASYGRCECKAVMESPALSMPPFKTDACWCCMCS